MNFEQNIIHLYQFSWKNILKLEFGVFSKTHTWPSLFFRILGVFVS